jgi:hypothetical protein
MCETLPIKNIPRKKFEFKKSRFGEVGTYDCYTIHIEYDDEDDEGWFWFVHRKITIGAEICSCEDNSEILKSPARTAEIAIKRAISALNKWRRNNL